MVILGTSPRPGVLKHPFHPWPKFMASTWGWSQLLTSPEMILQVPILRWPKLKFLNRNLQKIEKLTAWITQWLHISIFSINFHIPCHLVIPSCGTFISIPAASCQLPRNSKPPRWQNKRFNNGEAWWPSCACRACEVSVSLKFCRWDWNKFRRKELALVAEDG